MQRFLALSMAVILMGATSGCGPTQSSDDSHRTDAEKQQTLHDSSFGPMVGTMGHVRSVELLQQNRKGNLDAAMEKSRDQQTDARR